MNKAHVKNWAQFQHYKNRNPPWVKLHKGLLDDFEFSRLHIASKALAPLIWLLASESNDGTFEADAERLAFRLRWNVEDVRNGLSGLIERGFVICASNTLADCLQHARPETETETETEKKELVPHSAKSRAARLPQDWQPTFSEMRWASDARPDVDAQAEVEKFRDYWHAKAGRDACKRDWSATWRNWIRNSHGSPRSRGSPQPTPSKMASAVAALEGMKHEQASGGMVPQRNSYGVAETRALESGQDSGVRHIAGHGAGVDRHAMADEGLDSGYSHAANS